MPQRPKGMSKAEWMLRRLMERLPRERVGAVSIHFSSRGVPYLLVHKGDEPYTTLSIAYFKSIRRFRVFTPFGADRQERKDFNPEHLNELIEYLVQQSRRGKVTNGKEEETHQHGE